ncbi:uncharacterized protein MELLADRAFT_61686 [Melampsora larici-populina 98AG31]|uniref:ER membrane protein complex subunit 10 n=1 Tax=Melampsora larici-populina (strain 98AG31 / pathotype 3-4-7) TaxID=747676 RepID=F4RFW9_MELLP|nr:uncharacterized protein MELLADRAFT_61686 [Melampsora larici-populina 98AG31]EGG08720.1 hypothetical protein MELLADRAFT_61686 [Melampsora larici-populina 98AG31]
MRTSYTRPGAPSALHPDPNCVMDVMLCLLSLPKVILSAEHLDSYTVYHRLAPLELKPEIVSHQFPWEARATLQLGFTPTETPLGDLDDRQINVLSFPKLNSPLSLTLLSKANVTLYYQLSVVPSQSGPPSEEIGVSSTRTISSAPLVRTYLTSLNSIIPYKSCLWIQMLTFCINRFDDTQCALDTNGQPGQEVQEYFNLWLRPKPINSAKKPTTFVTEDYDLLGINWATNKLCSTVPIPSNEVGKMQDRINQQFSKIGKWKSRISVRLPESLPKPVLKDYPTGQTPEILSDGSIKPPPKEQGWLAKYWMYILPLVVLLLLGGGAPEEEEGARPKS